MAAPQQDLFFDMAFSPSHYAPPDAPTVVFTLSGLKNCYAVEADGSRVQSTDDPAAVTTQIVMPPKCVNVPLYYLFAPRLWHQTASSILSSSGYFLPGTAPRAQPLLRHLCDHLPAHVNDAYSHGYTRVDVAIDVLMWVPVVRRRRRRLLVVPSNPSPAAVPSSAREESDQETRRELQLDASEMTMMKLKELGEIESCETCPICFEEFGESKKAVTETPCAHLFHSDCLLPWLLSATTCPLCRSTLHY
ncbi:hypothetical protein H6P81_005370 [Aristolochia fimbriata]|uniref:RING-type domain-containing protein n=1 Tax=Aristolochia fimbriata TaxID=158543 RepID=A0AAV7EVD8_ARIFI|nr:hypothetical protein H6P81_005370 [Aristolochia fimbriata]